MIEMMLECLVEYQNNTQNIYTNTQNKGPRYMERYFNIDAI